MRVVPTRNAQVSADSNTLTSESDQLMLAVQPSGLPALLLRLSLSLSCSASRSVRVCKRAKSHFIEHLRH